MSYKIKLQFEDEIHLIPKPPSNLISLTKLIPKLFSKYPDFQILKYYDSESDWVTLTTQEDYQSMMGSDTENAVKTRKIIIMSGKENKQSEKLRPSTLSAQKAKKIELETTDKTSDTNESLKANKNDKNEKPEESKSTQKSEGRENLNNSNKIIHESIWQNKTTKDADIGCVDLKSLPNDFKHIVECAVQEMKEYVHKVLEEYIRASLIEKEIKEQNKILSSLSASIEHIKAKFTNIDEKLQEQSLAQKRFMKELEEKLNSKSVSKLFNESNANVPTDTEAKTDQQVLKPKVPVYDVAFSGQELQTIPPANEIFLNLPTIIKLISLRNTGDNPWPENCSFQIFFGDVRGEAISVPSLEPIAKPFQAVLCMTGPREPGEFVVGWKLIYKDSEGEKHDIGEPYFLTLNLLEMNNNSSYDNSGARIVGSNLLEEEKEFNEGAKTDIKEEISALDEDNVRKLKQIQSMKFDVNVDEDMLLNYLHENPFLPIDTVIENLYL